MGMRERGGTPQARQGQKLVIGPWCHTLPLGNVVGDVDFGFASHGLVADLDGLHIKWFDYWLKGKPNGLLDEPPVRLFTMGANTWRTENEWPLARTRYTKHYLHGGGQANSLGGDGLLSPDAPGSEPADVYVSDPRDPVPTRGGAVTGWPAAMPGGAFDQRQIEERADVLVLHQPRSGARPRGDRTAQRDAVCGDQRGRYRLYGQAGRRGAGRLRAQPHAMALSVAATGSRKPGRNRSPRARCTSIPLTCGRRAMCSKPAIASGLRSPAQIFLVLIGIPKPGRRLRKPADWSRPCSAYFTMNCDPHTSCCRSSPARPRTRLRTVQELLCPQTLLILSSIWAI